jgi:hypothetical protein
MLVADSLWAHGLELQLAPAHLDTLSTWYFSGIQSLFLEFVEAYPYELWLS